MKKSIILVPSLLFLFLFVAGCTGLVQQPYIDVNRLSTRSMSGQQEVGWSPGFQTNHESWRAVPVHPPTIPPDPRFIVIPSLGIKAPLTPVGLEPTGIMASPAQAHVVGWYKFGPRPGANSNAILAGHINWYGQVGAFKNLHLVQPGDIVQIMTDRGFYRFAVQSIHVYPNDRAPIETIFASSDEPQLTLITCAGQYNPQTQTYPDRLVVVAKALPGIYYENGKPLRSHYFVYQQQLPTRPKRNPRPPRDIPILFSMHTEKAPETGAFSVLQFLQALPNFYDNLQLITHQIAKVSKIQQSFLQNPQKAITSARRSLTKVQTSLDAINPVVLPIIQQMDALEQISGSENLPTEEIRALWTFVNAAVEMSYELISATELTWNSLNTKNRFVFLLDNLPSIERHLAWARFNLLVANTARDRLRDLAWLPDDYRQTVITNLQRWDQNVEPLNETLSLTRDLVQALPLLLGRDHPVSYLILLENRDELRANGGFVAGLTLVTLDHGQLEDVRSFRVTDMEVSATWNPHRGYIDPRIQPPLPLRRYMNLGHWMLRDVTWWASFPTSAKQVEAFWKEKTGQTPDLIIAINENSVLQLLHLFGPVTLTDGTTITADNLIQTSLERVYSGNQTDRSQRQAQFSTELATALLNRIFSADINTLVRFLQSLLHGPLRDEVLITSTHPKLANLFFSLNLDGHLINNLTDDYWYLVESNVSYNKLSQSITHKMTYQVLLDEKAAPLYSQLQVDVVNSFQPASRPDGYPDIYYQGTMWNSETENPETSEILGFYGGYTRLYLAPGSILLDFRGFDDSLPAEREGESMVIGGYIGLKPGEKKKLYFTWAPKTDSDDDGHFNLLVQRQPGSPVNLLDVSVKLPKGYCAEGFNPALSEKRICSPEIVHWSTRLTQTQIFSLELILGQ